MDDKQLLTNSSLTTFRACPRKYQFRYEQGYSKVRESEALFFGTLMHAAIETWSARRNLEDAQVGIRLKVREAIEPDTFLLAKAQALMVGYHAKYKDEPYEVVAVEQEYRAPLLNPDTTAESRTFVLAGKIDGLLKDDFERLILKETKTTSMPIDNPAGDYWAKLGIDSQISGYFLGMEAMGHKVESCLYDVIRKPTIRPSMVGKNVDPDNPKRIETPDEYGARLAVDIAERPGWYFARREIVRSVGDLSDYLFDVWHTANTIRNCQLKGKFPRNTKACLNFGSICEFFDVCCGRIAIEDGAFFKKSDVKHRELMSQPAKGGQA